MFWGLTKLEEFGFCGQKNVASQSLGKVEKNAAQSLVGVTTKRVVLFFILSLLDMSFHVSLEIYCRLV